VPFRIVGHAEQRIDDILRESAQTWGLEAAGRYHRLMLTAMAVVGDRPDTAGSRAVPQVPGVRTFYLRSARRLVAPEQRVGRPRHLLVYRVAPDGVVEILSVVHDWMLLPRAVREAQREAPD
jgi:toxin ParE1/3/4